MSHTGLPVAGYQPQSQTAVDAVNEFKRLEEQVLQAIDALRANPEVAEDGRWLAIGITHLEQGFMAVNRSIFKPKRLNAC